MSLSIVSLNKNLSSVRIAGNPIELSRYVTRLFNYGIIDKMPHFKREIDDSVYISANRKTIVRGFLSMAEGQLTKGEKSFAKHRGNKRLAARALGTKTVMRAVRMARPYLLN